MSRLRAGVKLAGFLAMTLPLMPLQWVFLKTSPRLARNFPHHYHRWVTRWLNIRIGIKGGPIAPGTLIAANHVSWMDITVLSAVAPLSFIAKKEVAGWAGFGTLARLQRTVFVDRERRQATGEKRDEIAARLAQGDTLVLFAEGTSSDGLRVLPFKSAFFAAAEAEGVRVQPLTIAYRGWWGSVMSRRRLPFYAWYGDMDMAPHLWEALATGPVEVEVILHDTLTSTSLGGRKQLAALAEAAVRGGLNGLGERL
ncbi:MAG: lysophospholipid acyltransferase family protein [Parvibaculaceae bacterium]